MDGDSHFVDGAKVYDDARQRFFESFGIQFLRFTNRDIYENLDGVCKVIINHLSGMNEQNDNLSKQLPR